MARIEVEMQIEAAAAAIGPEAIRAHVPEPFASRAIALLANPFARAELFGVIGEAIEAIEAIEAKYRTAH